VIAVLQICFLLCDVEKLTSSPLLCVSITVKL